MGRGLLMAILCDGGIDRRSAVTCPAADKVRKTIRSKPEIANNFP